MMNLEMLKFLQFRDILYDIFIYQLNIYQCVWYIVKRLLEQEKIKKEFISKILIKTYGFFQYYNNNYRPIYHLEYFIRQSRYIRNYILHDEPIQHSKLVQIKRIKDKTKQSVQGDFTKQYPQIIHKLFGRKINLISYKNED